MVRSLNVPSSRQLIHKIFQTLSTGNRYTAPFTSGESEGGAVRKRSGTTLQLPRCWFQLGSLTVISPYGHLGPTFTPSFVQLLFAVHLFACIWSMLAVKPNNEEAIAGWLKYYRITVLFVYKTA